MATARLGSIVEDGGKHTKRKPRSPVAWATLLYHSPAQPFPLRPSGAERTGEVGSGRCREAPSHSPCKQTLRAARYSRSDRGSPTSPRLSAPEGWRGNSGCRELIVEPSLVPHRDRKSTRLNSSH